MNILVAGAGGFIGGHLVNDLIIKKHNVISVDRKPFHDWYQLNELSNNIENLDLKELINCQKVTKNIDHVINLACDMGGIGYITSYKADCMLSVLVNTNLLRASKDNSVKKFFFSSSACIYPHDLQSSNKSLALKESDAYPANCQDGYGWEKLFSERMCRHFKEDFGLKVRIARFHNCYGPYGAWKGGREKAPAAIARKFVEAKLLKKDDIEIWGDGNQVRSFMYVDDVVTGIQKLIDSNFSEPLNVGSSEDVSINTLADILEEISGVKPKRNYNLSLPQGVYNRNSDNTLIKEIIDWEPSISLKSGMEKTFKWIYDEFKKNTKLT
jgi:GDP-D-mannose 3', 5'-epimerase